MYTKYLFIALLFLIIANHGYSNEFVHTKHGRRRSMVFNLELSKSTIQDTAKIRLHLTKKYHLRMYAMKQGQYLVFTKGSYITCIIKKYRLRITDLFNKNIRVSELRIKRRKMKKKNWPKSEFKYQQWEYIIEY